MGDVYANSYRNIVATKAVNGTVACFAKRKLIGVEPCRVDMYFKTNLTFRTKDKLVAISGVAKRLGLPKDEYRAGLWKPGLAKQLQWVVATKASRPQGCRGSEYRAPSWSWASIDGPVITGSPRHSNYDDVCVDILDEVGVPLGSYLTGRVAGGSIRLEGMLARARLSERLEELRTRPVFQRGQLVELPIQPASPDRFQTRYHLGGQAHYNVFLEEGDLKDGTGPL